MVYSGLIERFNTLLLRTSTAYFLHAQNPSVKGNDAESLRQWCAVQEVRNLLAERNPLVAGTLLPNQPGLALVNGLPLVPAGVRFVVDENDPYTVDFAVELAGVTFKVDVPGQPQRTPAVSAAATRTSTTFAARVDELYTVRLYAGSSLVTTILVPVNRAILRALREHNRQGAYQFLERLPEMQEKYRSLVAIWIAANDAAATGQSKLYYDLIAAAAPLLVVPRPTAVYPHRHV